MAHRIKSANSSGRVSQRPFPPPCPHRRALAVVRFLLDSPCSPRPSSFVFIIPLPEPPAKSATLCPSVVPNKGEDKLTFAGATPSERPPTRR